MQTRKDDSTFPVFSSDGEFDRTEHGLTKREYFAALALQGILSNPSLDPDDYNPSSNAILAIEAADLLIYNLNKSHENRP